MGGVDDEDGMGGVDDEDGVGCLAEARVRGEDADDREDGDFVGLWATVEGRSRAVPLGTLD